MLRYFVLDVAMRQTACPRLSEAKVFLPGLHRDLLAGASRFPIHANLALDLLPISEGGLFGYELLPDSDAHAYLIIGRDAQGEPTLCKTVYAGGASNGLQLATIDGRAVSRSVDRGSLNTRTSEVKFVDWPTAVESTWRQLLVLFPQGLRRPIAIPQVPHRCLDEALSIAYSHLAIWDPFIMFCGVPNEAQQGFALFREPGEHGELVFQRPDIWMLRWRAPPHAVYESWSIALPDIDMSGDAKHLDSAS